MLLKTTVQTTVDARDSTFNNVEGHQTNNYYKTYNIFIGYHAASFIVGVLFFWFVHSKYASVLQLYFLVLTHSLIRQSQSLLGAFSLKGSCIISSFKFLFLLLSM
jgi:hypothetical protein